MVVPEAPSSRQGITLSKRRTEGLNWWNRSPPPKIALDCWTWYFVEMNSYVSNEKEVFTLEIKSKLAIIGHSVVTLSFLVEKS